MIIKFQLNAALKFPNTTKQLIISYQDEDVYRYIYSQIKQKFADATAISITLEQASDWQQLFSQTHNYTLLPEPNLYEISLLKSALQIKSLTPFEPLDTDIYIFKTSEFKHALLSTLEKNTHSVWIQAYNPQPPELWQWLQSQMQGVRIDPTIKPWFLQQTGIQFRHCWQLVEKLRLNQDIPATLSLDDIKNGLGLQTDDNWQPLIDAWMRKDLVTAIKKLKEALQSQQELSLLLWLLGRNLQVLFALKQNVQSSQHIFSTFKIWPKQTQVFIQAKPGFSLTQLSMLIHQLQNIELAFKSGLQKQIPLMLEQFFIRSCVGESL